jgi:hypothetical protein
MRKIGRNELCPCGSGKKYKKCHGVLAIPPVAQTLRQQIRVTKAELGPIPPEMASKLAEQQRRDEEFTRQFGHVRPPTATEVNGYKLVVAGGGFVWQRLTKPNPSPIFCSPSIRMSSDGSGPRLSMPSLAAKGILSLNYGSRHSPMPINTSELDRQRHRASR